MSSTGFFSILWLIYCVNRFRYGNIVVGTSSFYVFCVCAVFVVCIWMKKKCVMKAPRVAINNRQLFVLYATFNGNGRTFLSFMFCVCVCSPVRHSAGKKDPHLHILIHRKTLNKNPYAKVVMEQKSHHNRAICLMFETTGKCEKKNVQMLELTKTKRQGTERERTSARGREWTLPRVPRFGFVLLIFVSSCER